MRGEFIGVWSETWREIWLPLSDEPLGEDKDDVPSDIFCELYRALAGDLNQPGSLKKIPSIQEVADILDSPIQSREAFEGIRPEDIVGERALVAFFEATYDALEDIGGDELTNRYFILLTSFIEKFSLRYDLRRPCILYPTLQGVFASLVRDLRILTGQDPHLDGLMKDFEGAVRDLRHDRSDRRIKTCIQKQINLLEAIGRAFPGVKGKTLGAISDQVGTWPHEKLKAAMKDLYGFTCDYPGIRHGGTSASALRSLDMRDMVAMSILLMGFTPYLESRINAGAIFGGSAASTRRVQTSSTLPSDPSGVSGTSSVPSGLLGRLAFWRYGR